MIRRRSTLFVWTVAFATVANIGHAQVAPPQAPAASTLPTARGGAVQAPSGVTVPADRSGQAPTGTVAAVPSPTLIDQALQRMYNCDFVGAHVIVDEQIRREPDNPLGYAMRAAACLYQEYDRLGVLESQFFSDDDKVTDRKKFKPDPAMRARLYAATGEARRRAQARLARNSSDRDAMLAMCMTAGLETDYTLLVEKSYLHGYSLSKESQFYARKLLTLDPPVLDAYLTLGSVEYVVSKLNWFFRMFVHFEQIEGSKEKSIANLQKVISGGRYYAPMAKILLALICLREHRDEQALAILQELNHEFPENRLMRTEVARVGLKIARSQPTRSGAASGGITPGTLQARPAPASPVWSTPVAAPGLDGVQ